MGLRGDWWSVLVSKKKQKGGKECMGMFRSSDVSTTVHDYVLCREC